MSAAGRHGQGRPAVLIADIDLGAVVQQQADHLGVPPHGRLMNRPPLPSFVVGVDVGPAGNEQRGDVLVALVGRDVQRRHLPAVSIRVDPLRMCVEHRPHGIDVVGLDGGVDPLLGRQLRSDLPGRTTCHSHHAQRKKKSEVYLHCLLPGTSRDLLPLTGPLFWVGPAFARALDGGRNVAKHSGKDSTASGTGGRWPNRKCGRLRFIVHSPLLGQRFFFQQRITYRPRARTSYSHRTQRCPVISCHVMARNGTEAGNRLSVGGFGRFRQDDGNPPRPNPGRPRRTADCQA